MLNYPVCMTMKSSLMNDSPLGIGSLCREAFRRNRIPAVILQGVAASILALYFWVPALRPAFEQIGSFKHSSGIWFAIGSTAIFGGVIPWGVMVFRGRIPLGQQTKHLFFFIGFWALQGAMVDQLYTLQTQWFGSGKDVKTLMYKVLTDQIPFNLIWATPNGVFLYGWKNSGFSWSRFWATHPLSVLFRKYATIQISSWIVWIPAVLMIYSLPPDLQIPLFNLVLCFFSLILTFVSRD